MTESHFSLENDFDVTTHELDLMMKLSLDQRGCVGARMTGAGFGGCIVALFEDTHSSAARVELMKGYRASTGIMPDAFKCGPATGTSLIDES